MVRLADWKFNQDGGRDLRRLIAIAVALAGAAAGYACGSSHVVPQAAPVAATTEQTRVPGEYIVTLAEPADVKAISELYGRFGIKDIKKLGPNVFLVKLGDDPGPATMESLRAGSARIPAIEPNYVYRTQGTGGAR
jgi:hypothetical protein